MTIPSPRVHVPDGFLEQKVAHPTWQRALRDDIPVHRWERLQGQ